MNKEMIKSLCIQLTSFSMMFLGILLTHILKLDIVVWLVISGIIFILDMILFAQVADNTNVSIVGIIGLFATGLVIGSYTSKFTDNILDILVLYASTIAIIGLIHFLLLLTKYKIYVLYFILLIIFFGIIYAFSFFSKYLYREVAFTLINLFCVQIGLLVFNYKKDNLGLNLSGGMLWAFIIVFVIVLIIISEGEALSGLDGFDNGGGRKKKRK